MIKNKIGLLELFQKEADERKKVDELKLVITEMQKTLAQQYKNILENSSRLDILKRDLIFQESQKLDYEWKIEDLIRKNNTLEIKLVDTNRIYNNLEEQIEAKTKELDQIIAKCEEVKK